MHERETRKTYVPGIRAGGSHQNVLRGTLQAYGGVQYVLSLIKGHAVNAMVFACCIQLCCAYAQGFSITVARFGNYAVRC